MADMHTVILAAGESDRAKIVDVEKFKRTELASILKDAGINVPTTFKKDELLELYKERCAPREGEPTFDAARERRRLTGISRRARNEEVACAGLSGITDEPTLIERMVEYARIKLMDRQAAKEFHDSDVDDTEFKCAKQEYVADGVTKVIAAAPIGPTAAEIEAANDKVVAFLIRRSAAIPGELSLGDCVLLCTKDGYVLKKHAGEATIGEIFMLPKYSGEC